MTSPCARGASAVSKASVARRMVGTWAYLEEVIVVEVARQVGAGFSHTKEPLRQNFQRRCSVHTHTRARTHTHREKDTHDHKSERYATQRTNGATARGRERTFGERGVVDVGFGVEDFDEDVEESRILHQRGDALSRRSRFPFVDAHLVLQLI
jgi:hypothetical protein